MLMAQPLVYCKQGQQKQLNKSENCNLDNLKFITLQKNLYLLISILCKKSMKDFKKICLSIFVIHSWCIFSFYYFYVFQY